MPTTWKRVVLFSCAAQAIVPAVMADVPQTLDALVVSATRTETSIMESPVSISVVDEKEIRRSNAVSVADVLRDVPGVTIDESSLPGMKRIKIRGEEARRGAVLIDGQEITDHTSYGSPILIDPALIERIEVVRGPQSVLYGSKAISGVINIITKKGGDKPFQGSAGAAFMSGANGYAANALIRGRQDNWDYRLFVGRTEEGNRKTPDKDLPHSNSDSKSISGYLGYRMDGQKISFAVDRYELASGSIVSDAAAAAFTKFQLDMPQRDLQKFSVNYDFDRPSDWVAKVHADAYYQTIDRRFTQLYALATTAYTHNDQDTQATKGLNAQVDWTPHADHLLITGVQYLRDDLDKSMTRVGTSAGNAVNRYADMGARMETLSIFAQDTWKLPMDFSLAGGMRHYWVEAALDSLSSNDSGYKRRSSSDSAPIFSGSILYSGLPSTALRAGFAQGFVYPTLLQAYTGSYFGSSSTVRPNPNLKPETSNTWEAGARYEASGLTVDGSLFRTKAKNYIASMSCSVYGSTTSPCTASTETTYVNLDKVDSTGAELATQYRTAFGLTPYANGSWIRRKYFFRTVQTGRTGIPTISGRVGLRGEHQLWDGAQGWMDLFMRGGSRSDDFTQSGSGSTSLTRSPAWRTFNASFGADIDGYHLGLDLINLTNLTYATNPDEANQQGRSVVFSVRADF